LILLEHGVVKTVFVVEAQLAAMAQEQIFHWSPPDLRPAVRALASASASASD